MLALQKVPVAINLLLFHFEDVVFPVFHVEYLANAAKSNVFEIYKQLIIQISKRLINLTYL